MIETIEDNLQREGNELDFPEIGQLLDGLKFETHGYRLTDITNEINEKLKLDFNNRSTKTELLKHFGGENLSFSYSTNWSVPQIVFKRSIEVEDVLETRLRNYDPVKECADILIKELKEYDFKLSGSLCTAKDISISQSHFEKRRPENLMKFLTELSRGKKKNRLWYLKANFIIQFMAYWLTSALPPIMCGITEMIHGMTKSKENITVLNRFGICISYDSMKRIGVGIVNYLVKLSAGFRCPVGLNIKQGFPLQLAIDNFNHKERTDSGGEVSNDTVGVIFQNQISLPGQEDCIP